MHFDGFILVYCCISSFLGEHGHVIANDFFAKKGRKSSVGPNDQNNDSKDDSLILISPPPKSKSPLQEKKTNTPSVKHPKTPLGEVQNSKPTRKKRKQEVEEPSVSWNSNPSPKPKSKKLKEPESIRKCSK